MRFEVEEVWNMQNGDGPYKKEAMRSRVRILSRLQGLLGLHPVQTQPERIMYNN